MVKRLRVFAGPNGSGKSTITEIVKNERVDLGLYCNADDIKKQINTTSCFDFAAFGLTITKNDLIAKMKSSSLFAKMDAKNLMKHIKFENSRLTFSIKVNDYFTSFLAAFIRENLLVSSKKFTFETVMSHPSKLNFMTKAKQQGFKVYLYFVALADPMLNMQRVSSRVKLGGHNVPKNKIAERYYRTLNLLYDAVMMADTSYIFDNSSRQPVLIATVINKELEIKTKSTPVWFNKYFLEKLKANNNKKL